MQETKDLLIWVLHNLNKRGARGHIDLKFDMINKPGCPEPRFFTTLEEVGSELRSLGYRSQLTVSKKAGPCMTRYVFRVYQYDPDVEVPSQIFVGPPFSKQKVRRPQNR